MIDGSEMGHFRDVVMSQNKKKSSLWKKNSVNFFLATTAYILARPVALQENNKSNPHYLSLQDRIRNKMP